jgi:hypothetical protein
MKQRQPNLEWIKKVLADLERDRGDPQIDALVRGLIGTPAEPVREPAPEPFGNSSGLARH